MFKASKFIYTEVIPINIQMKNIFNKLVLHRLLTLNYADRNVADQKGCE
jgi:hypothetical protein